MQQIALHVRTLADASMSKRGLYKLVKKKKRDLQ